MVGMGKYRHIKWDERETMKQAQIALDMMKDFHGKSLIETHGQVDGRTLKEKLGVSKWDKHHEYKVWLQDIVLRCKTATDPDDVFNEDEWQAVETYAIEDTDIDESIVVKGNKFRKSYYACSQKQSCIKIEEDELNVDNVCRMRCLEKAVKESGFMTLDELKKLSVNV